MDEGERMKCMWLGLVSVPPPSNFDIADPECSMMALTNTPLGVKAPQNLSAGLHRPIQKLLLLEDMKYCRTSRAIPAAAGVAMEEPVMLMGLVQPRPWIERTA